MRFAYHLFKYIAVGFGIYHVFGLWNENQAAALIMLMLVGLIFFQTILIKGAMMKIFQQQFMLEKAKEFFNDIKNQVDNLPKKE